MVGPTPAHGDGHGGGLTGRVNREDLETVAGLLASGTVRPVIDRTYPLAQAAAAVQYLQEGHTQGKVVIAVR